jgi:site-specific recombinase XerD
MCYRKDWAEALKLAGITDYRFHDNRHTCGSYLAMAGYTLAQIAEILNHKTLEMAKRYSHLADEYREKLSARMSENFIAGTVNALSEVSGLEHPAISSKTNSDIKPQHDNRPHLRRVK